MVENIIQWLSSNASILIPIASIIISSVLGYYFGNWNAKKNKLLERRTETLESVLRSISNLIDRAMKDVSEESIDEIQMKLNENLIASKMYLDPKMRNELKKKADEFDKYFKRFQGSEIEYFLLRNNASEFAEKIFEIMKFKFTLIPSIKSKEIV